MRKFAALAAVAMVGSVLALTSSSTVASAAETTLVSASATWRYNDTGTALPGNGAWAAPTHNDATWASGVGEFGYGDGDETTVVSYGNDPSRKHITTYFRTTFDVVDPAAVASLTLHLLRDDGAVAYLNGTEIVRSNVAPGATSWWTFASTWNTPEDIFTPHTVDPALLVSGTNTLAVSVHQAFRSSGDLSFHATLDATLHDVPPPSPVLVDDGHSWKYEDTGTPLPGNGAWATPGYDDSTWTSGAGEFGYGDGDETTVVSYGNDPNRKHITTYFRTTFSVADPSSVESLTFSLLRDDGAVAYLNGTEIVRSNVEPGSTNWWTFATSWNTPEDVFTPHAVDPGLLVSGTNTLAVSVHQAFRSSGDLSFHATLEAAYESTESVLLAVGDIGSCPRSEDDAVGAMVSGLAGAIATLGDHAYSDGTQQEFDDCFLPAWGDSLPRIRPAVGNHEYNTTDAGPYFNVFGAAAGDPSKGYYSYDLGDWRIVVLNTNCGPAGGCDIGSDQHTWVQSVVADAPECLLAYGHHPIITSVSGSRRTDQRPLLEVLHAADLDVYLAGHAHNYERFEPIGPFGFANPDGFQAFVVGTGGITQYQPDDIVAPSQVVQTGSYGVLELTLGSSGYAWEFLTAVGDPFTDTGTGTC